jgi:hypothetical protein
VGVGGFFLVSRFSPPTHFSRNSSHGGSLAAAGKRVSGPIFFRSLDRFLYLLSGLAAFLSLCRPLSCVPRCGATMFGDSFVPRLPQPVQSRHALIGTSLSMIASRCEH